MSLYTNCVTANLGLPADTLDYKKVRIINFFLYLVVVIDLALIGENFKLGQVLYAYSNILAAVSAAVTIVILRRGKVYIPLASHLTIIVMIIILIPALFEGGIANSGFVWFFLTPPFAVHLLGQRDGLRWVYFLLLTIALVFVFVDQKSLPYDKAFLIYLSLSLIVETAFSIYLLNIQKHFALEVKQKNDELLLLTETLHEKVKMEVDASRKKDALISQQSKMAAVGDMVSSISHQWKQPLTTISTIVQSLQIAMQLGTDDERMRETSLSKIHMQTTLMEETMRDFLLFHVQMLMMNSLVLIRLLKICLD
jgi:signal transduction histidine kinase